MIIVTHSTDVANQFDRVDRLEELNLVVSEARKKSGQGAPAPATSSETQEGTA